MSWRSTSLQLAADHCPAVLDFLDAGAPYPRDVFHVGTGAHCCLEDIGHETVTIGRWLDAAEAEVVAQRTCEKLIAKGRDFEGVQEPPLPSAKVWQGRDLALRYQAETPLSPKYRYEEVLAVSRDFLPCPTEGAWLKARIDAHGTFDPADDWFEEDTGGGPILEVRDYKSAYSTDETDLRTIQRKIQAVVSWAHWGDGHEALRLVVVNFRNGKSYDTMVYPRTPEGEAVMERWKGDIRGEIKAREGERTASPGACCFGCPFLAQCPDALAYLPRVYGTADPQEAARSYAVNLAVATSMEPALRRATADEPIEVPGGWVGTKLDTERKLRDDAPQRLAEFWLDQAKPTSFEQLKAMLPGLLTSAGIGTGQAENLLKKYLRKDKNKIAEREAFLVSITRERLRPQWGSHRGKLPSLVEGNVIDSESGEGELPLSPDLTTTAPIGEDSRHG